MKIELTMRQAAKGLRTILAPEEPIGVLKALQGSWGGVDVCRPEPTPIVVVGELEGSYYGRFIDDKSVHNICFKKDKTERMTIEDVDKWRSEYQN